MSETQTTVADEAPYGESVTKSETSNFTQDAAPATAEPEAKPAEPEVAKPDEARPEVRREDARDARIRQQNAKIGTVSRERDDLATRNAELERRLNPPAEGAQPAVPVKTQADYDRDVQTGAEKLSRDRAFTDDCNKIAEAGNKEFPADFRSTLDTLWGVIGGVDADGKLNPSAIDLIESAQEADNPAAILHHLGKNLDEATRIAALPPKKMVAAVMNLSKSLDAKAVETAAAAKASTKAPAPMESVSGGARAGLSLGEMGMADYIKARDAQDKAARAR